MSIRLFVSLLLHLLTHFDLMHPVPTGSQAHLGMLRSCHIAMPSKMAPSIPCNAMSCVNEIVMLVLVTLILMYL